MSASELSLASTASHVSFDSIGQNFGVLRQRAVDIARWTDFNSIRVANPKIVHTFRYTSPIQTVSYVLSLDSFFGPKDYIRQIMLIDRNLLAILADDITSSSIIKVFSQRDDTYPFHEIYTVSEGLGMIIRLFFSVTGLLLFVTSDGTIHNLGDPRSPHTLSPSPITCLPTRCPWIGFARVNDHVSSLLPSRIERCSRVVGSCVWIDCERQITCE